MSVHLSVSLFLSPLIPLSKIDKHIFGIGVKFFLNHYSSQYFARLFPFFEVQYFGL